MKTTAFRGLVMAVVVLASTLLAISPAGASSATNETFILIRDGAGNEDGWHTDPTSPEVFNDSGGWGSHFQVAAAIPSPVTFEGVLDVTLSGSAGAIDLQFQVHLNVERGVFAGTWQIVAGRGAYQNLRGAGTWSVLRDPNTGVRTYTCPGLVLLS